MDSFGLRYSAATASLVPWPQVACPHEDIAYSHWRRWTSMPPGSQWSVWAGQSRIPSFALAQCLRACVVFKRVMFTSAIADRRLRCLPDSEPALQARDRIVREKSGTDGYNPLGFDPYGGAHNTLRSAHMRATGDTSPLDEDDHGGWCPGTHCRAS